MNRQEESERGHMARQILENPLYAESIQVLKSAIYDKWRACPLRDRDGAHELKLMDKLLTDFEGYFKQVLETGKLADIQTEQDRKLTLLKRAGVR